MVYQIFFSLDYHDRLVKSDFHRTNFKLLLVKYSYISYLSHTVSIAKSKYCKSYQERIDFETCATEVIEVINLRRGAALVSHLDVCEL